MVSFLVAVVSMKNGLPYFGQWLSEVRSDMGLSLSVFSMTAKTSPSTIKNILMGRRGVSIEEAERICKNLGMEKTNINQFKSRVNIRLVGWRENEDQGYEKVPVLL